MRSHSPTPTNSPWARPCAQHQGPAGTARRCLYPCSSVRQGRLTSHRVSVSTVSGRTLTPDTVETEILFTGETLPTAAVWDTRPKVASTRGGLRGELRAGVSFPTCTCLRGDAQQPGLRTGGHRAISRRRSDSHGSARPETLEGHGHTRDGKSCWGTGCSGTRKLPKSTPETKFSHSKVRCSVKGL